MVSFSLQMYKKKFMLQYFLFFSLIRYSVLRNFAKKYDEREYF